MQPLSTPKIAFSPKPSSYEWIFKSEKLLPVLISIQIQRLNNFNQFRIPYLLVTFRISQPRNIIIETTHRFDFCLTFPFGFSYTNLISLWSKHWNLKPEWKERPMKTKNALIFLFSTVFLFQFPIFKPCLLE